MSALLVHFLAIIPGLLICYLIFRLDKYEREPISALIYCFFLGMLATLPVIYIQQHWGIIPLKKGTLSVTDTVISSFGFAATAEEFMKFAVLLVGAYPKKFFNEPVDGIVYAVLVAMGFATVENVIYGLQFGMNTTIVRAFTAVPAHFVFAIVQGYYFGIAKFRQKGSAALLLRGLLIAICLHGLYDFLILQELSEWLSVLGSLYVYVCLYYCGPLIREHLDNSPFRR
ncbi:MAG: PrsW family intramembrane metalloprotease [Saprospiraceae bacterium]|nr:PrsW family intramembrane metalloprotease [Saprospiraceae bacterium]